MQQLYTLVAHMARTLNTSQGNLMANAIELRDWHALNRVEIAPGDFTDPESYWQHSQVKEILRKGEFLTGDPAPLEKKATEEFYRCEALNFVSNRRIRSVLLDQALMGPSELRIWEFFQDVKREIGVCLGKLPEFDDLNPRFGPGATFSERRPVSR